jgi:hypothetical protein
VIQVDGFNFIIIIINIKGLAIWAVSSPDLQAALAKVSLVSQMFSFLVDCSVMILKGFGGLAFFAGVKTVAVFICHVLYGFSL